MWIYSYLLNQVFYVITIAEQAVEPWNEFVTFYYNWVVTKKKFEMNVSDDILLILFFSVYFFRGRFMVMMDIKKTC